MALVINGERIESPVLETEFGAIKAHFEQLGNISCCERDDEFRGYARENIIARVLLAQEAQRRIPARADEEIDMALEKLKADHGGEDQFLFAFGATKSDYPQIRRDLERELRVAKLVEEIASADANPDEKQLRAFYQSNIEAFMSAEEVRASHILKSPARSESRSAAYEAMRDVRRQLLNGADFDAIARDHSDKADESIDLGFFKRGELPEEFETVAFSMEVGEISPVFGTSFGFHLIKVTERKPAEPKGFEVVRDEVRERYLEHQRQQRTRELVRQLQQKATIEEIGDDDAQPASAAVGSLA